MSKSPSSDDERVIELGSWTITGRGTDRKITLYPFKTLDQVEQEAPATELSKDERQRENRRAQMQLMLDTGVVKNRAELAKHLGLSRARITQILGPARPRKK